MTKQRLAEIGRNVARQLRRVPGIEVVEGNGLEIFVRQNFLTPHECGGLIAMIDADRKPSKLLAIDDDPTFRTSESCDLDRWNPFVEGIDRRICSMMGLKVRQGETLQGQRYTVGQEFKAHYDYFQIDLPYWTDENKRGGQRTWTAMIFLDEPAGGGQTQFPSAGFYANPRTGALLAWNNMDKDGLPNRNALHAGMPVTAGVKTIVTKWFRERFWA